MESKKIKIGVQGDRGSTNERAGLFFAKKYNWQNFEISYLITTENVLKSLQLGEIDFGTFAFETSRAGLVEETKKAMKKYSFQKVAEEKFLLDHVLLKKSEIDLNLPVKIFSHPQAIQEHKNYLQTQFKNIDFINEIDTAVASKKLSDEIYPPNSLVIAPKSCSKLYNLKIFQENLPSNKGYFVTIFLVKK